MLGAQENWDINSNYIFWEHAVLLTSFIHIYMIYIIKIWASFGNDKQFYICLKLMRNFVLTVYQFYFRVKQIH